MPFLVALERRFDQVDQDCLPAPAPPPGLPSPAPLYHRGFPFPSFFQDHKGGGIVHFRTRDDMDYALRKLDGSDFRNPFEKSRISVSVVPTVVVYCGDPSGFVRFFLSVVGERATQRRDHARSAVCVVRLAGVAADPPQNESSAINALDL